MLFVYTATIFLSASLLFLVQPMVARMLLPLLGGGPSVWNTSMVFFQAVLLAGYTYAHLLTRHLSAGRQVLVHACVLVLPVLVLAGLGYLPVLDPRGFSPPGSDRPALWLLGALALAVGAPFFVLSTTGPLMQRWFAATTHRHAADPYFLYAASNVGSMLALLGYPFVMERTLKLGEQRAWFSAGFFLFAALAIGCGVMMLRGRPVEPVNRHERRHLKPKTQGAVIPRTPPPPISNLTRLRWVLLAAVPSSLMLGVTQHVSSDIASFPLMWVIPLALYLLTFILAFSRAGVPVPKLSLLYFAVAGFLAMSLLGRMGSPIWAIIASHMLGLFLGALICHGQLSQERPDPRRLTEFYLLISLGGVLGGSFNALLAPVIFNDIAEYPIAIVAACLLAAPSFGDTARSRDGARPDEPAGGLPITEWARECAYFVLVALAWTVVFTWAARGGVIRWFDGTLLFSLRPFDFWVVFAMTTAGVCGYCLRRARRRPVVLDALAPLAAIFAVAGLQFAFRHAGWVGGWYSAAAAVLGAAYLAVRLALPREARVSWLGDLAVPATLAFLYLMAHPMVRDAQAVTGDGRRMELGEIRYLVILGPPALVLLLSIARRLRMAIGIAAVLALYYTYAGARDPRLMTARTFFGVHRVSQDDGGNWRSLSHGTTRHGIQALDPQRAMIPTYYYHPTGPVGQVFRSREADGPRRIAIIGLGTGGLAAYGRKGDTITYYEIDPKVVWIARDSRLFTFIEGAEARGVGVEMALGDGRLMLAKAPARSYDMIILDAFSSDSIPVHLLTREAVEMYLDKLAEGVLLVLHVSNRYLEARPVLGAIAHDLKLPAITREESGDEISPQEEREGKLPTTWVVIARRPEDFGSLAGDRRWIVMQNSDKWPRWTDDYSNIMRVLFLK